MGRGTASLEITTCVLIVDDDESIVDLGRGILEIDGFCTSPARIRGRSGGRRTAGRPNSQMRVVRQREQYKREERSCEGTGPRTR
jgi:hypothetical protein